jgi:hypothetical protein
VRAENWVFGAARGAEKTGCQRGLPGFFYQRPFKNLQYCLKKSEKIRGRSWKSEKNENK